MNQKQSNVYGILKLVSTIVILIMVVFSLFACSVVENQVDDGYYVRVQNCQHVGYCVSSRMTNSNSIPETEITDAEIYGYFSIFMHFNLEEWDLLNSGDDVTIYKIRGVLYVKSGDIEKLVNERE